MPQDEAIAAMVTVMAAVKRKQPRTLFVVGSYHIGTTHMLHRSCSEFWVQAVVCTCNISITGHRDGCVSRLSMLCRQGACLPGGSGRAGLEGLGACCQAQGEEPHAVDSSLLHVVIRAWAPALER